MRVSSVSDYPLVHHAWQRCTDRLLPPLRSEESTKLFHQFVYDRYTESQRHYHNLQHLEEMLGYLKQYEQEHGWHGDYLPALSKQKDDASVDTVKAEVHGSDAADAGRHDWMGTALLLSILFHDVVYDPRRSDNEEASAELALDFLKTAENLYKASCDNLSTATTSDSQHAAVSLPPLLWADKHAVQFVRDATSDFILKTKVHLSVKPAEQLRLSDPPTPSTIAASHDDPLHVFLDLDLSILGHPDTSVYRERYAANIGREYSHYPPADFLKGRSAFLNSFLCDAQWYKTPYFFARLEATARRNVATEAAELTAQLKELTATTPPAC